MTWIKDIKGDIINTDSIAYISMCRNPNKEGMGYPKDHEVFANVKEPGMNEPIIFTGTEEECKEYMDKLMMDLNGPRLKPKFYPEPHADYEALYDASKLSEGDTFRMYPNGPLQRCVKADRKGENMPYILFEEAK